MIKPGKIILLLLMFSTVSNAQVRNGWRSIYDKAGRLSRMNYYQDGINVNDSNCFFQYHTDFVVKALVTGEISSDNGCKNGSVSLFDYSGLLMNYTIKRSGSLVYKVENNEYGVCTSSWVDLFDTDTGHWFCDSFSVENSDLIIHNTKAQSLAIYNPELGFNLNRSFSLRLNVPAKGNSSKQGIALGWLDENNYFLFELSFGKYYSIQLCKNGVVTQLTDTRQEIEKFQGTENEIIFRQNDKNLVIQVNGAIEQVLPIPDYAANSIALITRSKGNARFSDFIFKYDLLPDDEFFTKLWIGKGTGFYFSSDGKILTTYDVVSDAKSIRVKGVKNGVAYTYPATVIRTEEENNLAVLQLSDTDFSPFDALPYGYSDRVPVSGSKIYSIGYPNAISGIYMYPEVFEGTVLPTSASTAGSRLLEMDFRNGMIGAPIFDFNMNLVGICSSKGLELRYSEMIDFYANSRLFLANMGLRERKLESPLKGKPRAESNKIISELVVIIESSVFDLQNEQ